jgi:hypothetical protein
MGILDPAQGQAPFSILGMLLGGRGYASNWLGERDALTQAAMERQRLGTEAQSLIASPQYKTVFDTPDKQAAGALWAKMQPDFSAMGNNLLSQKIGSLYQDQSTRLQDQLERERMGINVDDQLKLDATKRQRDLQDTQNQYKMLLGLPGAIGQTAAISKMTGIQPPTDSLFTGQTDQNGIPQVQLIPNSPTWRTGVGEISPIKNGAEGMQILSDMASGKTPFDQGLWNATRGDIVLQMKKTEGLGVWDEGTKELINSLVPDMGTFTPELRNVKATQLDIYAKKMAARAQNTAQKWNIPVDQVPSDLKNANIIPSKPPPAGSPYGDDNAPLQPGTSMQHPISSRERAPAPSAAQRSSAGQGGGTSGSGGVMATGRRMWQGSGR